MIITVNIEKAFEKHSGPIEDKNTPQTENKRKLFKLAKGSCENSRLR